MFTGLIASRGKVLEVVCLGADRRFQLAAEDPVPFQNLENGESIAVNGACLTVEEHSRETFWLYASAETLAKTTLATLSRAARPNLERALRLGDRLGGHLVTGHVDCVAKILHAERTGLSTRFTIGFPRSLAAQLVAKGSVALDGISLTINSCEAETLMVNIIPETYARTTVAEWREGSQVNLETDILGKYVSRQLALAQNDSGKTRGRVDYDLLMRHGFL
ncbi:MAG: riboflavin synthase [Desulfovibrio sp.]|nr:riboflavin synthase [Desulfovibrio sp.]